MRSVGVNSDIEARIAKNDGRWRKAQSAPLLDNTDMGVSPRLFRIEAFDHDLIVEAIWINYESGNPSQGEQACGKAEEQSEIYAGLHDAALGFTLELKVKKLAHLGQS